jgi:hypothetical protein
MVVHREARPGIRVSELAELLNLDIGTAHATTEERTPKNSNEEGEKTWISADGPWAGLLDALSAALTNARSERLIFSLRGNIQRHSATRTSPLGKTRIR